MSFKYEPRIFLVCNVPTFYIAAIFLRKKVSDVLLHIIKRKHGVDVKCAIQGGMWRSGKLRTSLLAHKTIFSNIRRH